MIDQWFCEGKDIVSDGGEQIASFCSKQYAKRAVACVNALEGLNPEAIPKLLDAAKMACAHPITGNWYTALQGAIEKLEGSTK